MRGKFAYMGVQRSKMKPIEKPFLSDFRSLDRTAQLDLARLMWQQEEREFQYLAMDGLRKTLKHSAPSDWSLYIEMISHKSWWDTVDLIASRLIAELVLRFPECKEKIPGLITSDNLWLQRTAIIHQLNYKSKTDLDLLEQSILPHLSSKEFFLQKAIGWALRNVAKWNPDYVLGFCETHKLSGLSEREALKHLK